MQTRGNRRDFHASLIQAGVAATILASPVEAQAQDQWHPRYILGSCLYGYTRLDEIVPEVAKVGAAAIDIWPMVHGNQREQVDEMGEGKFADLLQQYSIKLGCLTQYKLGPFALQEEMRMAQRLRCSTIVTGAVGPKGLSGDDLKQAIKQFVEKMKPHVAVAEETGVTIVIENHVNNLIESADSLRWLAEMRPSEHLAIGLAPYHLPQDTKLLSSLIHDLGDAIAVFYAWQHGMGSMIEQAKEQELLQLPGRGSLDFKPLFAALRDIQYNGWTEIFMHPFPRGIAIMETTDQVTSEIKLARKYISNCLVP